MKKLLLTMALLLLPFVMHGYERVLIGILYYNLNEETKEAEVTSGNQRYSFSKISIPDKVIYNGIQYSVTNICTGAFSGCTNLNSVTIPNSVTSIGADERYVQGAFWGCTGLTSIIIPNSVTYIGHYTFYNCQNLSSITIPDSVVRIGYSAFSGTAWFNAKPDGLIYVGKVAYNYKGTMSETNIIIEDGTESVSAGAFLNCSGLISVTIPNTVKEIGGEYDSYYGGYKGAFTGCSSLISLRIPDSVTNIGDGAFSGCSSLISATIPSSVISMGDEAFHGCSGLTSINLTNNISSIGIDAFKGCSSLLSVTIPNKVTIIKRGTFQDCSGLISVTIPNSVTTIEGVKWSMSEKDGGAFSGCRSLTNITIPNSVTTIADCAFRNCSALTSISIPSSVTTIGRYAFQGCIGLTSINISSGDISIGYNAFQNCSSLTSIDIPNGIKTIEAGLFMNCINLKSVSLPNSVTKISNMSENSVINGAFYGCQSLEKIILPDNLSAIEAETFMYCSKLSSITIPNTVTFIGDRAFYGCSSLKSLSVPSKVASIGEQAFWNCNKLITIDFSEGIISLKKSCFERCDNLKNVVIPSSVEAIYQSAFRDCNKLEYVKVLSETPPFLYDDSFSNYTIPLKVPRGCKEAYQGAPGWKNFVSISDADKYRLTYVVDSKEYKVYEIEEGTTITQEPAPTKDGYTFSGWSEIPKTMPAHDVIVTGSFTINKYILNYVVDGDEYKSYEIEYGESITPEPAPTKEGNTFSGWSEIPETMPTHDVTVTGSFTINSYKLTYMIDDKVYKETMYEYGAIITPELQPEGDYATFEWTDLPQTMPAHDVVVYANYTSGIIEVLMTRQGNIRIYSPNGKKQDKLQKGLNIVVLDDGTVKKVVVK